MKCFTADFETTADIFDCRVWAYAISEIGNPENFLYGNSLDQFMEWCANPLRNYKVFFHNLKFDGSFILSWLLTHGFEYISDKKDRYTGSFTALITDMGQFYSIEVYFRVKGKRVNKVTFLDSLKIFPNFSVERVAEGFNLPIRKLKIDYREKRPIGHELTKEEIDYIRNDVEIMSRALSVMFDEGLTKMTIASDAFNNYKDFLPAFRQVFPILDKETDKDIRKAYKGGFTYASPKYAGKQIEKGITLDVNSLYPSMMMYKTMPYGKPERFQGKYKKNTIYPLYIQSLTCIFEIKKDKIPSIQIKKSLMFKENEYLESSNGEPVELFLTNPDLELFFKQYNVDVISYNGGFMFKKVNGIFYDYINYWTEEKIRAGKEGNAPKRQIAKLMLNSLYGRFGLAPVSRRKEPYLDEEGIVRFTMTQPEERESIYIPVACFITAYARVKTILTSQAIRDYSEKKYDKDAYLYSDTDSIHCTLNKDDLTELNDIIEIDDYKLGAWAHESDFTRAIFLRQKCYIEEINGKVKVTVAGLPQFLAPIINFDNFKEGFTTENLTEEDLIKLAKENGATDGEVEKVHHKLNYKYVKGGVVLCDTGFTIK